MDIQIATYAFEACDLTALLGDIPAADDLSYVSAQGIQLVPIKRPLGVDLTPPEVKFNTAFSKINTAVEHAHRAPQTWRMPSEEGSQHERR
ncbi:MAG: hypothetical protein ABIZ05_13305 [Pseudonocardiaceae bacterium]